MELREWRHEHAETPDTSDSLGIAGLCGRDGGRGREDSLSYELTTDGREKAEKLSDRTVTSRLRWDGDVLVLQNRIVLLDGREAIDTVRYRMLKNFQTLVAEEEFRGPIRKHDNLWVADRKVPLKRSL